MGLGKSMLAEPGCGQQGAAGSRGSRQTDKGHSQWVGTAGGTAEHGQLRLERSGPESSGGCLSSTLKSLTKAGLNDQKFHLIGQIKK